MNPPPSQIGGIRLSGPERARGRATGHERPKTDREKRKAAAARRAQLVAPVRTVVTEDPKPAVCGFRWRNNGRRRRCCLPVHDLVEVAHFDRRSRANAWDPTREAEVAKRVEQDLAKDQAAQGAAEGAES